MIPVVSNSQMRTLDKKCISEFGIPGIVLMENAGRNAADSIIDFCEINEIDSVMLFAGKGNNGGDGFVVARYLQKVGLDIEIHLCSPKNSISGDAAFNLKICEKSKIQIQVLDEKAAEKLDYYSIPKNVLVVDALLGTGIKGAVSGLYAKVINFINVQDCFVCSIDIPSGINGDTAQIDGVAIIADFTITMGAPKLSQSL